MPPPPQEGEVPDNQGAPPTVSPFRVGRLAWKSMFRGDNWTARKLQWHGRVQLWRNLAQEGDRNLIVIAGMEPFWMALGHPFYIAMLSKVCRGLCDVFLSDLAWQATCSGASQTPLMSFGFTAVAFDLDPRQMQLMQANPWGGDGQLVLGKRPDEGEVRIFDMMSNDNSFGISFHAGFSKVHVSPNTAEWDPGCDDRQYHYSPLPFEVLQYPRVRHAPPAVHIAVPRPQPLMPSYAAYQAIQLWDTKFPGFASHMYACRMASSSSSGPPEESRIGELRKAGQKPGPPRWGGCLQLNTVRYSLQPYPSQGSLKDVLEMHVPASFFDV